ncbi:MAG: peptidoglycan editing factor PgeF [Pseudoxanthomonas sp.]
MSAGILRADWPAPPNVVAFTTLRYGAGASEKPFDRFNLGLRSGDDIRTVSANRNELIERFGLPAAPHWLQQVHGVGVRRFAAGDVAPPDGAPEPEADAAVTADADVVLAILTADCLPVVFAAKDGGEVGAAHAGWRGLAAGVLENTVAAMRTAPGNLLAWLGPAAGPEAYEIGQEVFDAFVSRDPRSQAAFAPTRPGHWKVDLYALARLRLVDAGIAPENVFGGELCTIGEPKRFYSHRRDARTGRMATLVWRGG